MTIVIVVNKLIVVGKIIIVDVTYLQLHSSQYRSALLGSYSTFAIGKLATNKRIHYILSNNYVADHGWDEKAMFLVKNTFYQIVHLIWYFKRLMYRRRTNMCVKKWYIY